MGDRIKKIIKAISEKGGIFMFLRAQFSSQIASITDFIVTIVLGVIFNLYYVYATFIGSVCGGIVNCAVNYTWTFKSRECKKSHVFIKYVSVWIGSIILNTSGTYFLTEALGKISWLREALSHYFDDIFIVSKVIVSLLVGFLWNYNMHRLFVYKNVEIKKFFRKKHTQDNN